MAETFLKEKLKIEDLDAFLLARYIIEPREQTSDGKNVLQKDRTAYRREIISRLKSIAYKKIGQKDFHQLERDIRNDENKNCKQKFYDEMLDQAFLDIISKDDILQIIEDVGMLLFSHNLGIKINNQVLLVLL